MKDFTERANEARERMKNELSTKQKIDIMFSKFIDRMTDSRVWTLNKELFEEGNK